jgi:hypothetical protein
MQKFLLIFIIFFFANSVKGQNNIKKYVQQNTVEISSIQPDSINFS